jgi:hypothetical protein
MIGTSDQGTFIKGECPGTTYMQNFAVVATSDVVNMINMGCGGVYWYSFGNNDFGNNYPNYCANGYNTIFVSGGSNGIGIVQPVCDGVIQGTYGSTSWGGRIDKYEGLSCQWPQIIYGIYGYLRNNRIFGLGFLCASDYFIFYFE